MKKPLSIVVACSCLLVATAEDAVTDFPVELLGSVNGMSFPRTSLLTTGGEVKAVAAAILTTKWSAAERIAKKKFIHAVGEALEIADKDDFNQLAREFGYELYSGENADRKIWITGFYNTVNPPTANNAVSRVYDFSLTPVNNALGDLDEILALNWSGDPFKLDITIGSINLLSSLADIDLYVDRGDVLTLRGLLKAVKGVLYLAHGVDFSMDYDSLQAAAWKFVDDCQVRGMDPIAAFDASPLARLRIASASDLQTARTQLLAACEDLTAGEALLKARTDSYEHLLTSDSVADVLQIVRTYKDAMLSCLDQLISPKSLASAEVATKALRQAYTGQALSPVIGSAVVAGVALPYELTGTLVATNAGTYEVTLVGYGRSTGTQTIAWSIFAPSVPGDSGATVRGDGKGGCIVTPSADKTEVVVSIPDGFDPKNVTVELRPEVKSVKPGGAKIRIVRANDDISDWLDIPDADQGVIDLTRAVVKESIVRETLDAAKGAVISLGAGEPSLTTAETRPGLVYTLVEGTTLGDMHSGVSTIGDGEKWKPRLTVTNGASGFYTIRVTK